MEQHILRHRNDFNCQELATIIYSYSKASNASPEIISELIPTVIEKMDNLKPKELTSLLMAYTQLDFFGNFEENN